MQVTEKSETQDQAEQPQATSLSMSRGKSIFALSVFALGLNASAAVYTLSPSDFALPDVSSLAELLPHQKVSDPKPDPVLVALKDIQSAQQKHVAALQENNSSLQQSTALLQQDSNTLSSLRQSIKDEKVDVKKISAQITDEHLDVKKMSAQISKLIAKVESLQNALAPEMTSSIRNRLTGELRKGVGQPKPAGVSVGEAPRSVPAATSPED
jgi:small-conductance mechanosensitive channel